MANFKAVDIGYGYLKYAAGGEVQKAKAVVAELGESLNAGEAKGIDVLTVGGVDYLIGDAVYTLGRSPIVANESKGRAAHVAYKVLALYALAKTYDKSEGPLTLITGLPFDNLDEADEVKAIFKGEHTVTLNGGKDIKLEIERVVVVSQGLGTFYSLVKQRGTKALTKKLLLVDLGFKTINYLPLTNGDINAEQVKTASELGIQDAYRGIADGINREFKTSYHFYDVDELLDHGVPQSGPQGKKYVEIGDRPYVTTALERYAAAVWDDLRAKYSDSFRQQLDEVVFGGGTAERVRGYLEAKPVLLCSFVEDSQDAQVLGYEIIASKL